MIQTKQTKVVSATERSYQTKKMVILGLITAMAYVVVFLVRLPIIPSVPFLDLEFKSAIILVGAFIFGPLSGFSMTLAVCIIEMLTISSTGIIGCIMNILATSCLVCPAAFIYKKKRTLSGAVIGLVVGSILMTIAMILWNYIVTPMYMGVPREAVVDLLIPAFIPFNLLKAFINSAAAWILYKFVVTALRKGNLIPKNECENKRSVASTVGAIIVCGLILLTCVLIIFAFNGMF